MREFVEQLTTEIKGIENEIESQKAVIKATEEVLKSQRERLIHLEFGRNKAMATRDLTERNFKKTIEDSLSFVPASIPGPQKEEEEEASSPRLGEAPLPRSDNNSKLRQESDDSDEDGEADQALGGFKLRFSNSVDNAETLAPQSSFEATEPASEPTAKRKKKRPFSTSHISAQPTSVAMLQAHLVKAIISNEVTSYATAKAKFPTAGENDYSVARTCALFASDRM